MYISDYGFAASNNYWTTTLWDYDLATNSNWLYLGTEEWPITRDKFFQYDTFYIVDNGDINWQGGFNQGYTYAVRPCFYLTSSIAYVSGSGTSSDPIRIN